MAAAGMPIEVHQLFALPAMGISPESINFKGLTMQSDKAICVRDESAGQKQVVLVDTLAGRVQKRMPMAAEAAILSPDARIIAVRAGGNMQIFNLELEKKIKSHKMPDDQTPVYWSWLNQSTVAIVTATSVYHWPAEGDAAPAKMFDRNPNLSGCQIIAYDGSADSKWLMVAGIKAGAAGGPAQGCMQLYSVERKVSQPLSAHAGCFTTAKIKGRDDTAILFCFVEMKPDQKPKLHIIEVGKDKSAPGGVFRLAPQDLPVAADAAADFPVAVQASKSDIVYVVTKMGYVYLFDLHTGGVIFRNRFSEAPVFAAVHHSTSGGVMTVSVKAGAVSVIKINEGTVVSYILNTLKNSALAMELSSRLGLAGADDLYSSEFESKLAAGDVVGAAKLAASAPGGALRTPATIERFKALPAAEGGQPPVLRYFATLMEHGKLNKAESIELAKPALQQGRAQLLEKWLKEDKLECSSELGDLVAAVDSNLALQVYMRGGDSHEKVVNGFLNAGEWSKIVPYAKQHGFRPNYLALLQTMVHQNPKPAQEFASQLVKHESGPLVEIPAVIDVFMGFNRLQECTSFLLDVLEEDRKDQGFLQTKLLEMNLLGGAPQVVDAILGSDMFHHFDKQHIAQLCERAQLYQRALELYSELPDIKRVLTYAQTMTPKFLESYFGELSAPNCLECLDEMLSNNLRGNLKVVVSVAQKYSEQLTAEELIKLFEAHNSYEGLFYYLGGIVNTSEDPEVHFKYIVAAANLKQVKEVERVCRDSTVYDAVKVKEFLIDAKLPDPRPLIHVCDRHGYVGELTQYLHANKMSRFIDVYVQKVSPEQTPVVVGKLLDLDADEEYIKTLLNNVGQACPVAELVEEVETRNRLRLLQPWLEQRIAEGNTEAATHNAIGKIYITLNKEPQQFLKNNQFYDSLVVGRFCEKLDPYLAYLAYRRAGGSCDEELIEVTNENGLFKDQARYLVERQNLDLWAIVLSEENAQRRKLIDQVTGTALPESKNPDEVSSTVKAFMAADLPNELIGLLEKLVLQGSDFSDNRNLQNLLILTAIKCAHEADAVEGRTMEYINRLDNFDGPEIAGIALKQEYELFEEAFAIYKKFKMNVDAINVLIDRIEDLDRAAEYAERCDESDVWSRLAEAQLEAAMVKQAINSYIKAQDPANYVAIIHAANGEEKFEDLVRFLEMARTTLKERVVDSEMIFALAMCDRLGDLETFITAPNVGDIQAIGDRCFDKELYEAARILFAQINNNAQLARCLVRLGRHKEAVDAAKKANSLRTWKEVNASCVSAGEFYLAQICGLQIIMSPDHLEELIVHYERFGHQDELIKLLEQGVGLEDAHQGIFTELGVLYSKYRPEKLMEHIKIYWSRVNVSKLLRACEEGRHWAEATFLYTETGDFDMAVRTMMEHSPTAFNMDKFFEVIQKVRNQELYYKAIEFFLEEEPLSLTKLLKVLIPKLDHSRVVHQLRKTEENLPLIMPYLKTVQKHNLAAVNEAINENYITEEDYEGLRASIDEHDNFDQIALAQRIEKHELLELRRIAALVYKRNKRFEQSINLSKSDNMYQDAIETAAESADGKLAEDLLRFFVSDDEVDKECFCACLYTCYDLIRPDVALELAWRHRVMDFAMPYIVQYVREVHDKLAELDARTKPKEEHEHDEATQAAIEAATFGMMDPNTLQIADYAYNGQGMPGYGMAPQGMGMGGMPQQGMPQQGMGMGGMGQSGMY